MLGVLRILLGPALLWQGARVRRNILRLPEPEGARTGGTGPLRVLILGDSAAAGVGVDRQVDALSGCVMRAMSPIEFRWQVEAQTGWTAEDGLTAVDNLGDHTFDAAIILLGVNNITTETGIKPWLATYAQILDRLRNRHGVARFYLCGMPPMGSFPALPQPLRWYLGLQSNAHDQALGVFAQGHPDAQHVRVESDLPRSAAATDGFHPGPLVYAELGENFAAALRADVEAGVFVRDNTAADS